MHISFANNPPHKPTQERYEHRHDWRKGYRQHTKITTGAKSVANAVDAAELRFAMSGVTAIAGAGGAAGLVRNVDGSPALFEDGLKMAVADSDTFPLKDSGSSSFPTTCSGFPAGRRTAASIANLKGYLPAHLRGHRRLGARGVRLPEQREPGRRRARSDRAPDRGRARDGGQPRRRRALSGSAATPTTTGRSGRATPPISRSKRSDGLRAQ